MEADWLDELRLLRRELGPMRRMAARCRVVMTQERSNPGPTVSHVEVALYPLGARPRDLPAVIVDVPPGGIERRLAEQGGQVDVAGVPEPGHAVVLVFDDGRRVPCQYPAVPPRPLGARHRWGFRPGPVDPGRGGA